MIEIDGNQIYVKTMASSLSSFMKVSDALTLESTNVTKDSLIITSSMAESYGVSVGDSITLYVGTSNKTFQIATIVKDGGLFQGETIFILKSENLSLFLAAIIKFILSLKMV